MKEEADAENVAEIGEKNSVIEVTSDEESCEGFVKKEPVEDISKEQPATTLKIDDKDSNENTRKRKASFDGPSPVPQKVQSGSFPKVKLMIGKKDLVFYLFS